MPDVRCLARNALWRLSDRLCAHPHTVRFEVGNWLGELGWRLRRDRA